MQPSLNEALKGARNLATGSYDFPAKLRTVCQGALKVARAELKCPQGSFKKLPYCEALGPKDPHRKRGEVATGSWDLRGMKGS